MSPEPINPVQLYRELNDIKDGQKTGFDGIHERLDILNGRTRRLENKITIIWWIFGAVGMIFMTLLPLISEKILGAFQ